MKHVIFCYGTCKLGYYFHNQYLGGDKSVFLGPGKSSKDLTLFVEALPVVIEQKGDLGVKGELYEIDTKTLEELDSLEGFPEFMQRKLVDITTKEGKVTAWVYLANKNFKGKSHSFITDEFI